MNNGFSKELFTRIFGSNMSESCKSKQLYFGNGHIVYGRKYGFSLLKVNNFICTEQVVIVNLLIA